MEPLLLLFAAINFYQAHEKYQQGFRDWHLWVPLGFGLLMLSFLVF